MSGKNATVVRLGDFRTKRRTLYFTRSELNQLLSLYSRHVMRGVWRDYAIDHRDGQALFSVFRHTHESPAYSIVKSAGGAPQTAEYAVICGRQKLRMSRNLSDALDYFRSNLSLVAESG